MTFNPNGLVQVGDFGAPKVLSGKAKEVISGGQFVFTSGATGVVGSGTDTFATADVQFATGASGANFTGISNETVASGALVPVSIDGLHILSAAGTIISGQNVVCAGADAVLAGVTAGQVIGRAITAGASGGFCVVQIK